MDDAIVTGFFTIGGIIIGFGLSHIANYAKERKTKRETLGLLIVKLLLLESLVKKLKEEIDGKTEIKSSSDLEYAHTIFRKASLQNRIETILEIAEISITTDVKFSNDKHFQALAELEAIRIMIEHFHFEFDKIENCRQGVLTYNEDLKPTLITLLNNTLENIQSVMVVIYKI
jgi:hypothetical protein